MNAPLREIASSFEWIDVPAGPQPIPEWLTDLHIDWAERWTTPPTLRLKTNTDAREWPNKIYDCEDGRQYVAKSPDGRLELLSHSGALTWNEQRQVFETTQQEGFGGSCWPIKVKKSGAVIDVVLRGPWDVGTPSGYTGVSYVDPLAAWRGRPRADDRPWFERTSIGGLAISDDLFIRAVARFSPTSRIARIWDNGRTWLEPVRSDWDAPKEFVKRARRVA